jgi:transposase
MILSGFLHFPLALRRIYGIRGSSKLRMTSDRPSANSRTLKHRHHKHRHSQKPSVRRQPETLPSNVQDLQAMVMALQHEVAQLRRMLFGRRSERLLPDDPNQALLFGRIDPQEESGDSSSSEEQDASDEEPAPRRRPTCHRGRRPLPAHLMRCVHDIHPPEEERTCPSCGHAKRIFGRDVTEELEMIPAKYFVNRYVRHKYACPHCQGSVSQGPLPARPIDKGIPGPGFLADLIASKYSEHLPLYRLEERYRRSGLRFSCSTLCNWVDHVAGLAAPIAAAIKKQVLSSRKVHTDDTPITVLDPSAEPVHSRRGYMWVYISEFGDVVFDYTNSRKRDGPASFLKEYRGYLQADAFSGYDGIYAGGDIVEVACWAHARRKFYETLVHYPTEAKRILELIGQLYAVESRAKKLRVKDDRRLAWRQRFSRRRLGRLRRYLDELSVRVLPKSPLGKAITYTLKNWTALNRYTEVPFLSIDNNLSERQIKQMVIGRKAWLFAGSEDGARNAAILFSLVVSCKLAEVDPFAYLKDVLARISTHPVGHIEELIPREWKKRFGPQTSPAAPAAA